MTVKGTLPTANPLPPGAARAVDLPPGARLVDLPIDAEQPIARAIDLTAVLASLNSMSSDGVRQLFQKLTILNLVHEANRYRSQESEHYNAVQRVLAGAGAKLL